MNGRQDRRVRTRMRNGPICTVWRLVRVLAPLCMLGPNMLGAMEDGQTAGSLDAIIALLKKRHAALQRVWGRFEVTLYGREPYAWRGQGGRETRVPETRKMIWGRDESRMRLTEEYYDPKAPEGMKFNKPTWIFDRGQTVWYDPLLLQAFIRPGWDIPPNPGEWSLLVMARGVDTVVRLWRCASQGQARMLQGGDGAVVEMRIKGLVWELHVDT